MIWLSSGCSSEPINWRGWQRDHASSCLWQLYLNHSEHSYFSLIRWMRILIAKLSFHSTPFSIHRLITVPITAIILMSLKPFSLWEFFTGFQDIRFFYSSKPNTEQWAVHCVKCHLSLLFFLWCVAFGSHVWLNPVHVFWRHFFPGDDCKTFLVFMMKVISFPIHGV